MTDKSVHRFTGIRLVLALILASALTLAWTSLAYAQTSSNAQYGSPTEPSEAVISLGVLPSTGGPMIPFVLLSGLALLTVGLLVIRRLRSTTN